MKKPRLLEFDEIRYWCFRLKLSILEEYADPITRYLKQQIHLPFTSMPLRCRHHLAKEAEKSSR